MFSNIKSVQELAHTTQKYVLDVLDINTQIATETLKSFGQAVANPQTDTYLKKVNEFVEAANENVKKAIKAEKFTFAGYSK